MTKVVDKIDRHRRHFIGAAVLAVAAAELGLARPTFAQAKSRSLPVVKPGTNTSFDTLKLIEAGALNVGYAEAGPTHGAPVILLHGWPFDIHSFVRAGRRGLQMALRLLAHNAEHWLSGHLNAYLCDDDEYRAITRQTIIRGLAGTITWAPAAITIQLDQPGSTRVARALALLINEINATPPAMPGDSRPITYHLAPRPGI